MFGSLLLVVAAGVSSVAAAPAGAGPAPAAPPRPLGEIVPAPVSVKPG
ncbi:hypothetical protein [Streptomyces sp. NPDC058463]